MHADSFQLTLLESHFFSAFLSTVIIITVSYYDISFSSTLWIKTSYTTYSYNTQTMRGKD